MSQDYTFLPPTSTPLVWSHELAVSAGRYLQWLDGCQIHPLYIIKDGHEQDFLKKIANFDQHARHYMIPNRMRWSSLEEQVFDFIDDSQHEINKRSNLFNPEFTQIGVACNCHDIYGEICIVELGANVVGKEHLETITHDVYRYGVELEHSHANENDTMPIPEFLPKGSPNCARGRTDTICGEVENTDYADYVSTLNMGRPSSFLNDTSVHDYYEVAHNLFMSI